MTANAMQGDRERCLEAGMDDYLAKPVHRDQLRLTLARRLAWDRPRAGDHGGEGTGDGAAGGAAAGPGAPSPAAVSRPPVAAHDDLPLVDTAKLREFGITGEAGRAMLRELGNLFAVETPELIERIGDGIDGGGPRAVEAAAHKLRGSALQMAASRIAALAEGLEMLAKGGSLDGADALLERIDAVFGITVGELRRLARVPAGDPITAVHGRRGAGPTMAGSAGAAEPAASGRASSRPVGAGAGDSKGEVVA